MDKLFGLPVEQFMTILLAIFAIGAVLLIVSALRNRTSFRMAVRNIPRRKFQSILIVVGLMLATMLFSASFTTGDTLTNSIRAEALKSIGEVDVEVKADTPETQNASGKAASTPPAYFGEDVARKVQDRLSGDGEVAGVAPLLTETAPVVSQETDLSAPRVDLLGMEASSMGGFDRLTTISGEELSVGDLGSGEVYISSRTAEELGAGRGDKVEAYVGDSPTELTVAGVYEEGANPASETSAVTGLGELQSITGNEGKINSVIITHQGEALEGAANTAATVSALESLLEENNLKAETVKRDALEAADEGGQLASTIFLLFGQFSVAAGVLLIFLIFVMLAAERSRELGVARAVGMGRGHLIRMFAYEGALYALIASAIGSVLGVGLGWAMVRIIAEAFSASDFEIAFAPNPANVLIAFTLGMALTFAVVFVSAWRVSRLNVIRAIRDIPEPDKRGRSVKGVLLALALPALGALFTYQGFGAEQMGLYMLGLSLVIIGVALIARIIGVPDRVAFTSAGVGLLALWLSPVDPAPEGMSHSMDMFFISGVMIVLGAIWVIIYNADILLRGVVAVFGNLRGLAPVLKTAVKYPMQSRFRTGMTLAMFSLVVFTLVTMSFITKGVNSSLEDTDRISGGFEIQAESGYGAPVSDMETAVKSTQDIAPGEITGVGSVSGLGVEARQAGTDNEMGELFIRGVDEGYSRSVDYPFNTTAAGYGSDRKVWEALQGEEDVAVVSAALAPSRSDFDVGAPPPPVELSGFYQEDATLPDDLYIEVEDPRSGNTEKLRVVGVLDEEAANYAGDVLTSQKSLDSLAGAAVPPQSYVFGLEEGVDQGAFAKALEKGFAANGLQATVMAERIRDDASTSTIMNNLLTGFMGLGLVVGIAALGVIAARSVVERRQQIGVLRALGFQKGQVRLTFLLESSFVAFLGIGVGVALGVALSREVIEGMSQGGLGGITYSMPWLSLAVIVALSYAASLLTTYLPARSASKVYPAEALRYE